MDNCEWEMWKWRKLTQRSGREWREQNEFTSLGRIKSLEETQRNKSGQAFLMSDSLEAGNSYQLFRASVSPEWDDKTENGGRWAVYGERGLIDPDVINDQWIKMVQLFTNLAKNSEEFASQLEGCAIDIRPKNYRISLWTRDKYNVEACKRIGEIAQRAVCPRMGWKYEEHNVNHQYKSSRRVLPLYTLEPLPNI